MADLGSLVIRLTADTLSFESAIDKSQIQLKTLSAQATKSLGDLAKSFQNTEDRAKIFGKEVDVLGEKQAALKKQIESLLANGMKPEDAEIQKLKVQYDGLTKEIKANEDAQKKKEKSEKEATEQSKKHEEQTKKTTEALNKAGIALSAMITTPVIAAFTTSIKSFAEAEAAAKNLGSAIKLAGNYTEGTTDRLLDFANQLMLTTGVSDELIKNLLAQAVAMGRTEEEAKKLAEASVDIAARGIMPLDAAFETLAVTYEGVSLRNKQLKALTGELTEEQLRNGDAVDIVAAAVKGAGVEMRATTAGGMTALKNSADELGESFGAVLAPSLNKVVNGVIGFLDKLASADEGTKTAIVTMLGMAAAIGPLILVVGKLSQAFTFLAANPYVAIAAGVIAVGVAITGAITKANIDRINETATGFEKLAEQLGKTGEAAKEFAKQAAKTSLAIEDTFKSLESQFGDISESLQIGMLNNQIAETGKEFGLTREEILRVIVASDNLTESTRKYAEQQLKSIEQLKEEHDLFAGIVRTKNEEAKIIAENLSADQKAYAALANAIAYQNNLVIQGAIDEKTALAEKIKLRQAEIDRIIKSASSLGNLNSGQIETIKNLRTWNEENQKQLDLFDKQSKADGENIEKIRAHIAEQRNLREVDAEQQKLLAAQIAKEIADDERKVTTEQSEEEIRKAKEFIAARKAMYEVSDDDRIVAIKEESEAELQAAREFIAQQRNLREVDNEQQKIISEQIAKEIADDERKITTELSEDEINAAKKFIDARKNLYEVDQNEQAQIKEREAALNQKTLDDYESRLKTSIISRKALREVDYLEMEQMSSKIKKLSEDEMTSIYNNIKTISNGIVSVMSGIFNIIKDNNQDILDSQLDTLDKENKARQDALDKQQEAADHARDLELAAQDKLLSEKQDREDKYLSDKYDAMEKSVDDELELKLDAIDKELQEALYAAGLAEAETEEQLEKEIKAAKEAGDEETAAELQETLDKLRITQQYEAQKLAAEEAAKEEKEALDAARQAEEDALEEARYQARLALEEARYQEELKLAEQKAAQQEALDKETARKKAQLEYNAALITWGFNLATAIANAAVAAATALLTPPVPNLVNAAVAAAAGAVQIAAVSYAKPTPPTLAEGGIIPAVPGGTNAIIGEAGENEAVIPLSKLDSMLARAGGGTGAGDNVPIDLTIKMDSKVLYSGIFAATKNRSVLINVGSLVG